MFILICIFYSCGENETERNNKMMDSINVSKKVDSIKTKSISEYNKNNIENLKKKYTLFPKDFNVENFQTVKNFSIFIKKC